MAHKKLIVVKNEYFDSLLLGNIFLYEVLTIMCQKDKRFIAKQKTIYNTCQRFIKILLNGCILFKALFDDFTR